MTNINPALITQLTSMNAIKEKEHGELALRILSLISYFESRVPAIIFLGLVDIDPKKLRLSIELLKKFKMIENYYRGNILILDTLEVIRENTRLLLKEKEEEILKEALDLLEVVTEKYGESIDTASYLETVSNHVASCLRLGEKK